LSVGGDSYTCPRFISRNGTIGISHYRQNGVFTIAIIAYSRQLLRHPRESNFR